MEHWKKLRTSNMVERTNQVFKRHGRVVRIFPNPESCVRLYGAIAKEWDEDWVSGKKYLDMAPLVGLGKRKRFEGSGTCSAAFENSPECQGVKRSLIILQKKSCISHYLTMILTKIQTIG